MRVMFLLGPPRKLGGGRPVERGLRRDGLVFFVFFFFFFFGGVVSYLKGTKNLRR